MNNREGEKGELNEESREGEKIELNKNREW